MWRTSLAGFENSQVGTEIGASSLAAISVKPAQAFAAGAARKTQGACARIGIPVPQTNQSHRIDVCPSGWVCHAVQAPGSKVAEAISMLSLEDQTEANDHEQGDGGGGWIRTNVGLANGFTVRPL
jgi:hypothetical protein